MENILKWFLLKYPLFMRENFDIMHRRFTEVLAVRPQKYRTILNVVNMYNTSTCIDPSRF